MPTKLKYDTLEELLKLSKEERHARLVGAFERASRNGLIAEGNSRVFDSADDDRAELASYTATSLKRDRSPIIAILRNLLLPFPTLRPL